MNQAHNLIMHHHSEIMPSSTKLQSVHLSAVDVRAFHLGVEPAKRCPLAEHCQPVDRLGATACAAGLFGLIASTGPSGQGARGRHTTQRRARAACYAAHTI
jgi:hypothetical protein